MPRKPQSRPKVRPHLGGEVRRTVLPSGLRVVTERVPRSRTFTVGFFVDVGSVHETPSQSGASHFLEHVLFKGTARRSPEEISTAIESVGGEINAYTAKEHTCFYARVLADDSELAVDVLSDMITSSLIISSEVRAERAVILDEIAMHADDPVDSVQDLVTSALMPQPGLGQPVIGTEQTVTDLTRQQIVRYWRRNYHPAAIVVSAAGAVDHDRLVEQLSGLDDFGAPARRPSRPPGQQPSGSALIVDRRPFEQSTVSLAYPGPGIFEASRFPLGLMSIILGGGMSSRLFIEVRERRGLAYGIEAGETAYTDQGLWSVDWQCSPDKLEDILILVRRELENIAADGVTEEELTRATGQMRGQTVLAYEGPQSRMSRLGIAELVGDQRSVSALLDEYDRVQPDDVARATAELLSQAPVLAVVGPRKVGKRVEKLIS